MGVSINYGLWRGYNIEDDGLKGTTLSHAGNSHMRRFRGLQFRVRFRVWRIENVIDPETTELRNPILNSITHV